VENIINALWEENNGVGAQMRCGTTIINKRSDNSRVQFGDSGDLHLRSTLYELEKEEPSCEIWKLGRRGTHIVGFVSVDGQLWSPLVIFLLDWVKFFFSLIVLLCLCSFEFN